VLTSATNQLQWKEGCRPQQRLLHHEHAGTKAVVGFAGGQKFDLGNVTIAPQSRFGAIMSRARRREYSDNAKEVLIVAMARARNTGQKFRPRATACWLPGRGRL
jgi:hypothetical protein